MPMELKRLREGTVRDRGAFEELLRQFVEVPSVSADPDRKRDL